MRKRSFQNHREARKNSVMESIKPKSKLLDKKKKLTMSKGRDLHATWLWQELSKIRLIINISHKLYCIQFVNR